MFTLGCFELLFLVGLVAAPIVLYRTGLISSKALLVIAGVFLLAVVFLWLASMRAPHRAIAIVVLLLLAPPTALLIWAAKRWLWPNLLAEGLPSGEFARLLAPVTARANRLISKRVILGSLILAGLVFLVLIAIWPPRNSEDLFAAALVVLFCWSILFLASLLVVWLFRTLFQSVCPPIGRLKDLLAERLPSAERIQLTAHLDGCSICQHRVEGLTAGQKSWPGLARKLSERSAEPEPALQKLMARLKEEIDPAETQDPPAFAADLPLGFLSPSDKPGLLGRLERYEVLEEVGRGGMGVVLKAFDPSLHRVVAIKVLAPQLATSGVARKRFLREAKAAAAVTHDHIVTIHAVEESHGLPYLVMQYVAGPSLQERIDKEGPLDLAEIVRIGMQTASGLAAAHAQGIVHRDIKPANILLEEGVPRVKITDFGLARAMDDASLTQSGFVAGSPLYMAPEQARGEALDQRADLFSLGSVLYTMCTGRPPFRAPNTLAVLRRVSEESPRPIRETNPDIPDWLAAVVEKLMAKEPAERFPSAAEVVEVLGRHLAPLQDAAWAPPPRSPVPLGANAGLPTSVTLCPSCGASLHVPERMVGSVVHCEECGKPFHVEEGSEIIQVARAVEPPFGPRRHAWRKRSGCVWIAAGCAAFLFFLILFRWVSSESRFIMPPSPPAPVTSEMPQIAGGTIEMPSQPSSWRGELHGLPPEATLFGAIDFKAFGSLTLEDGSTQVVLHLALPREKADRLNTENLGRIRLDGVALGYYEGPKAEKTRAPVHLNGLALDGRKRIIETIRQMTKEQLRIEEKQFKGVSGKSALISGELPFAIGIYDDQHLFLARDMSRDGQDVSHREVLEQLPWFDVSKVPWASRNILSGYNPPWVNNALAIVPSEACGVLIGEIPAAWRKNLTDALGLRVCPRSFVCHLKKEGQGVALLLTLNLDKSGTDGILRDDLEKWRRQAIDVLRAKWPALSKEPQTLEVLGQTFETMRWTADRGSVRTQLHVSAATWKAVCALLKHAIR